MSPNNTSERLVSLNNSNPNSHQKHIYDEINNIFKKSLKDESEPVTNPNSARLFYIANRISDARENHLKTNPTYRAKIESFIERSFSKVIFNRDWYTAPLTDAVLKERESIVGASLFGTIAPNMQRAFWVDNLQSWFFHHKIVTPKGVAEQTFHYEVQPTRIIRVINEKPTRYVDAEGDDLKNLLLATESYYERVMREVYGIETTPDKKAQ